MTTATAVFAVAAMGVVVGSGHLALGAFTTALVLLLLEFRNLPGLRRLDARRYQTRFRDDYDAPGELHRRHSAPPDST